MKDVSNGAVEEGKVTEIENNVEKENKNLIF